MAAMLRAYLDESASHRSSDPHTYLLAASICSDEHLEAVRAGIGSLLLKGHRKLHWRDESEARRALVASAVSDLPLEHVVVVRTGISGEKDERRRRLCLQQMMFELENLEVRTATFESRGRADDRRDRQMVDVLRARRVVGGQLRIEHEKGPLEPLLWLPDAICGAVTAQRAGNETYVKLIASKVAVTIVTIGA